MEKKKRDKHHLEHKIDSNYNKSSAYSIMLAFLCLAGTIQSLFVFIPFFLFQQQQKMTYQWFIPWWFRFIKEALNFDHYKNIEQIKI